MNWITCRVAAVLEHLDGRAGMTHTPQGSVNDDLSGAGPEVHEKYSYCGDSIHMDIHTGTHLDNARPRDHP